MRIEFKCSAWALVVWYYLVIVISFIWIALLTATRMSTTIWGWVLTENLHETTQPTAQRIRIMRTTVVTFVYEGSSSLLSLEKPVCHLHDKLVSMFCFRLCPETFTGMHSRETSTMNSLSYGFFLFCIGHLQAKNQSRTLKQIYLATWGLYKLFIMKLYTHRLPGIPDRN